MKDRKIFKGSSGAGVANKKVKETGWRRSWDRINLTQDDRNQVSKSILSKSIAAIQRTFVELLIEKHADKQRLRLWDDSKSDQC